VTTQPPACGSSRIAVLGAGALGSILGGRLALAGHEVLLISNSEEHIQAIRREGLRLVETDGRQLNVPVRAATMPEPACAGGYALVLVLVKAYDTAAAARSLPALCGADTPVLTLQNGLGNAETLMEAAAVEPSRLLAGTTGQGATLLGPGVVRHGGLGATAIAPWAPAGLDRARWAAGLLSAAGIAASAHPDPLPLLWGKLLINAAINPLGALLGVANGELLHQPAAVRLMQDVVSEVEGLAGAAGIELPYTDPWAEVQRVIRATATNRCSMLQDIERGRQTEIDAICGALVAEARRRDVAVPAVQGLLERVRAVSPRSGRDKGQRPPLP